MDFDLDMTDEKPIHLILTGNNGVGKTTFVEELYKSLSFNVPTIHSTPRNAFLHITREFPDKRSIIGRLDALKNDLFFNESIQKYTSNCVVIPDNLESWHFPVMNSLGEFLVLYYPALRAQNFNTPDGSKKQQQTSTSKDFLNSMVNLKTQAAFANLDGNHDKVKAINNWFVRLEDSLAVLFGHEDFRLEFIGEEYNFVIVEKDKEPYRFTELSAGYSAILSMVADIMLHMTTGPAEIYDMPGIVIIDELETHLHVELQKKILPFLTKLFPKIQFVVTTHSPFILSSISDSVIYDLGNKKSYRDLSSYSYSNLIEGYFDNSMYSEAILTRLGEIERIFQQDTISDSDRELILKFDDMMSNISRLDPLELENRWLDMKLTYWSKL